MSAGVESPSGWAEQPVVFGSSSPLVGVVTAPAAQTQTPAALLLNAGLLHRIGAQRMNVQLARALAGRGARCLRFDCSGIGDSPARRDNLPFAESSVVETIEAMDSLEPAAGFVLIGLCSGADQAFQVALADERVRGVVLLDPYPYETPGFRLHRVVRPLRRAETWKRALRGEYGLVSRARRRLDGSFERPVDPGLAVRDIPPRAEAERGYRALLDRGVSIFVVFTAGQLGTYNHAGQFWEMHPTLPRDDERLRYEYFGMADHTMSQGAVRELLVRQVGDWYADRFGAPQEVKR